MPHAIDNMLIPKILLDYVNGLKAVAPLFV